MLKRLFVLLLAAALFGGIACGGSDNKDNNNGTPGVPTEVPTNTPPPAATTGTVVLGADTYAVGASVQVSGANWRGTGPVALYLLNADQVDDPARTVANGEAPKVGQTTADATGNISFSFALASSYTPESGSSFTVTSGQPYTVFALQNFGGSVSDPFNVP